MRERIRGEVVEVTDGGYFTVRYDEGAWFKNYPPRSAACFTYLTNPAEPGRDIPNQPTEAYSSCPTSDNVP